VKEEEKIKEEEEEGAMLNRTQKKSSRKTENNKKESIFVISTKTLMFEKLEFFLKLTNLMLPEKNQSCEWNIIPNLTPVQTRF
jgi:hypothetical protein